MPISRIFQAKPLTTESILELDEPASHHLMHVLRIKINETVIIFNGEGGEYEGIVTQLSKKHVTVALKKFIERDAESPLELWLAQGISRGEKMDYTIQKAVELGVNKIIPLLTERSTVKLDQERRLKRWQHWNTIIINACEQCGRTKIPELVMPISLTNWLAAEFTGLDCYVLSPHQTEMISNPRAAVAKKVVLLVGPEGGLSATELELAQQKNFNLLTLGPRILRTETAAIAALTTFQCRFGDMQY